MTKTISLILSLCLLPFIAFSQEVEEQIAAEVCIGLSKLDLTQNPNTVNTQAKKVFTDVYTANGGRLQEKYNQFRAKNKGMEAKLASEKFGKEILFFLMKDCESFQRITMFNYGPVPKLSETTLKVGKDFTDLFNEKAKTGKVDEEIVNECIMMATIENYDLIEENYGKGNSPEFQVEFEAYLMTKCIPYMRWMVTNGPKKDLVFSY